MTGGAGLEPQPLSRGGDREPGRGGAGRRWRCGCSRPAGFAEAGEGCEEGLGRDVATLLKMAAAARGGGGAGEAPTAALEGPVKASALSGGSGPPVPPGCPQGWAGDRPVEPPPPPGSPAGARAAWAGLPAQAAGPVPFTTVARGVEEAFRAVDRGRALACGPATPLLVLEEGRPWPATRTTAVASSLAFPPACATARASSHSAGMAPTAAAAEIAAGSLAPPSEPSATASPKA